MVRSSFTCKYSHIPYTTYKMISPYIALKFKPLKLNANIHTSAIEYTKENTLALKPIANTFDFACIANNRFTAQQKDHDAMRLRIPHE